MPEGHTIHRYAREHTDRLGGRPVEVTSPQGRFATGAAKLDGRTLCRVDAYGKHLFYRWEGDLTLHVHLGLFGRFTTHTGDPPEPTAGTRLVLRASEPDVAVHLAGPIVCDLMEPAEEEGLLAALGPDPLAEGADGTRSFAARLAGRRGPIGTVLIDQGAVAGIGNAFRAEALFVRGLDPGRPAGDLDEVEADRLWGTLVAFLEEGARTGWIHTVPEELADGEHPARYVYRRAGLPCRRCATAIRQWELGGRKMYACPRCQGAAWTASNGPRA